MSLRLAADENFHGAVVRGLLRHVPNLDIVRIQDVGLSGAEDGVILDWAAREGRVLLTHDISTVPPCAHQRVGAGQPMAGVIVARESLLSDE
jgi:predicted nuclease of predicted toxin-antitoxin system